MTRFVLVKLLTVETFWEVRLVPFGLASPVFLSRAVHQGKVLVLAEKESHQNRMILPPSSVPEELVISVLVRPSMCFEVSRVPRLFQRTSKFLVVQWKTTDQTCC